MGQKQKLTYALGGFVLGVLLTCGVWLWAGRAGPGSASSPEDSPPGVSVTPSAGPGETAAPAESVAQSTASPAPTAQSAGTWDSAADYTGGDTVSHGGHRYRAKWWTQGEMPGISDVWEDLGIVGGQPTQPQGVDNMPIDASTPQNTELTDFKVVGYYPSWKPDKSVDFGVVTHVCYAFAIPTWEGTLRPLENPDTARTLIRSAHGNGAKALLSVGGWSYNDTPLEGVSLEVTATDAGVERLTESILAMCREYGFDGVDMDWEHPRVGGSSASQYEKLMLALAERLHAEDRLLTAAVLSEATADGNIYYDAAAHTGAVLNAVDFINVMAYDGGDGEQHSSYQFAVDCGLYWKDTRGLPAPQGGTGRSLLCPAQLGGLRGDPAMPPAAIRLAWPYRPASSSYWMNRRLMASIRLTTALWVLYPSLSAISW